MRPSVWRLHLAQPRTGIVTAWIAHTIINDFAGELNSSLNVTAILILCWMFPTKSLTWLKTNDLESNGWEPQKCLSGLQDSEAH